MNPNFIFLSKLTYRLFDNRIVLYETIDKCPYEVSDLTDLTEDFNKERGVYVGAKDYIQNCYPDVKVVYLIGDISKIDKHLYIED